MPTHSSSQWHLLHLTSPAGLMLALAAPAHAVAQAAPGEIPEPLVTVTAGVGNAMGWFGAGRTVLHPRTALSLRRPGVHT